MARSVKKGPYVAAHLWNKIQAELNRGEKKKAIKTWSRRSTIVPEAVGLTFMIHNGKKFVPLHVSENMIGHKFGEFAPSRTFHGHAEKKAKQASR